MLLGEDNSFVHATFGFERTEANASLAGKDQLNLASDRLFLL